MTLLFFIKLRTVKASASRRIVKRHKATGIQDRRSFWASGSLQSLALNGRHARNSLSLASNAFLTLAGGKPGTCGAAASNTSRVAKNPFHSECFEL